MLKANSSLSAARKAYQARDYTAARAHLGVVRSTVAKANGKLSIVAVTSVPEEDRKQATVQATDPDTGKTVTINNNNYATTQQPGYQHYYGAATTRDVLLPRLLSVPILGSWLGLALTDVLLMDALLDDHWGGDYERGFEAGQDSATANAGYDSGQSTDYDSQQGDVGFDGSNQDSSFGGGYDSGGSFDFGGSDFGGVGSTRAAAATPGSNAFDRFHAEATNRHASASSSPGELGREELDAFGVVFGA